MIHFAKPGMLAGALLLLGSGLASAASESVVYNFQGYNNNQTDGSLPLGNLVDIGGTLYGTTNYGGAHGSFGVVYAVTQAGSEHVVYSLLGGNSDGSTPFAGLLNVAGTLYGTTSAGGPAGAGTIFKVTTTGSETLLHSFQGYPADGAAPVARLTKAGAELYGTTSQGGANGDGTVFKITTAGAMTQLHSFGAAGDGSGPEGCLATVTSAAARQAGGSHASGSHAQPTATITTLYGTTYNGGAFGYGAVFSISEGGTEKVIYSFAGGADGANPMGCLINVGGILYGVTVGGGNPSNYGTVFKVTTAGAETVLHVFAAGTDGAEPYAGLVKHGAMLYGTTYYGGAASQGTVFSITTSGTEKVLHAFTNTGDGTHPWGELLNVSGVLYGVTNHGGTYNDGTVFSVTP